MLQTYELLKERNSRFNDWENKQTSKLNFKDKIIQPIQRLPRYGLFIKDLLKHTPGNHLKLLISDPTLLITGTSHWEVLRSMRYRAVSIESFL